MANGSHPAFPARLDAAPDGALQCWVGAFYNEVAPTGLGRHHSSILKMRAWSDQSKQPCDIQPLHRSAQIALRRFQQQMIMVGHEHVGMERHPEAFAQD